MEIQTASKTRVLIVGAGPAGMTAALELCRGSDLEVVVIERDEYWTMPDGEFIAMAAREMEHIGMIDRGDLLDATVVRVPKAYPAYFGTYDRMAEIRRWADGIGNLCLVGRNGMHRYNNIDHSMLTAMAAVDYILSGRTDHSNIWQVNTDAEYHESR